MVSNNFSELPVQINNIKNKIYILRNQEIIVDRDLAKFYCVDTRILNQVVKRNISRFPKRFLFQLTTIEFNIWKSQIVMSNKEKMGLRKNPFAFTEQGVSMLLGLLNSKTAIVVSIQIIDAFVSMRRFISSNTSISNRLEHIE